MNFSRGLGGLCHTCGNSGGVGGPSVPCKNGKSRGVGGGVLSEIPSVVGVWIFSGTTHSSYDSIIYEQEKTGSSESQAEVKGLNQSQSIGMCIVIGLSFCFCLRFRLRQSGFH